MELLNFIGNNLGWFCCLVVVLAWVIKEKMTDTVEAIIEKPSAEIERPQLSIRVDVYEGDTAKIVATDAEGRLMPDILQQEGQEKALKLVGYAKLASPPIEAVREATTTLQGVEVEVPRTQVDEGLDVLFPDAPVRKKPSLKS